MRESQEFEGDTKAVASDLEANGFSRFGGHSVTVRGLKIGDVQLEIIREVLLQHADRGRTSASIELCSALDYHQPNGWPKERAMRDILRRLEALGLVRLPAPLCLRNPSGPRRERPLKLPVDISPIVEDSEHALVVRRVTEESGRRLWDQLISDHHYLGRGPVVGRNLRQLVFVGDRPVACLAWNDPCLKLAPRDTYLRERIKKHARTSPHHGVNNSRFLIVPWVSIPNLASRVLALATKHARHHWDWYYHADLAWAETFVDPSRFQGTCYLAANWSFVGTTKGTSRSGTSARRVAHGKGKHILIYTFGPRRKRVG